jgi:hypothetical protein
MLVTILFSLFTIFLIFVPIAISTAFLALLFVNIFADNRDLLIIGGSFLAADIFMIPTPLRCLIMAFLLSTRLKRIPENLGARLLGYIV